MKKNQKQDVVCVVETSWKNILQVVKADQEDHFFLSGGDSLLASMLVLSLTDTLNVEISLGDLYDNPTLKELIELVKVRFKYGD